MVASMVVPKAITENSRALVTKAVTQIHKKWVVSTAPDTCIYISAARAKQIMA